MVSCLFLVSGCRSAESILYEHQPSIRFYQNYDINARDIQPFTNGDVVFVVSLRNIGNPALYSVWQGLYTNMPNKEVFIESAVIEGNGWQEERTIAQSISLRETDDESGLLLASIKLFEVDGELLERAYQGGGNVRLSVKYRTNGEEGVMEYQLNRRVEKYTVFPT